MSGCRLPTLEAAYGGCRINLGEVVYDREGNDLQSRGLYLDVPAWQASVFALTRKS